MGDLFGLMCGQGALSISEWARMKSYRMARLWLKGFGKRNDAVYQIGWCISRAAIKPYCKSLPKDYPYALGGKKEETPEEMPEMNEEEIQARLEKMKASVLARAKGNKEE